MTDSPDDPLKAFGSPDDPTTLMGMFTRVNAFVWEENANPAVSQVQLVAVMLGYCQSVINQQPKARKEEMHKVAALMASMAYVTPPR